MWSREISVPHLQIKVYLSSKMRAMNNRIGRFRLTPDMFSLLEMYLEKLGLRLQMDLVIWGKDKVERDDCCVFNKIKSTTFLKWCLYTCILHILSPPTPSLP